MKTTELRVRTGERRFTDLTDPIRGFCSSEGDGLCSVFVPHATAGLAVIETGAGSEDDLSGLIDRLVPREAGYAHAHGSPGHGADHLLPALLSPSLVLPVIGGRPQLGTWQSVVLVDTNRDNPDRLVRLSFVAA